MIQMVVPRYHHYHGMLSRKQQASSPNKEQLTQPLCSLGLHVSSFMVDWLKKLALDPRIPLPMVGTSQELKNQFLKLRKLMFHHDDCSQQRKRSFETFIEGDNLCLTELEESSISGSVKRYASCISNDSAETSNGKCYNSIDSIPNNIVSHCLGMDESVDGCQSQPSNPENLILLDGSSVDSCDQIQIPSSKRNLKLITKDEKSPPRPIIPKGPRFQAEIPELTDSVSYKTDADSNKWLGTRIWPIDGGEGKEVIIGKGRPRSCSCSFPGSAKCVKYHISKAKEELQAELGAAFFTWEFDKMGEVVAKSFSSKQERRLESLLRDNPFSREKDVWDFVMKHFPSKRESSILSYYYNVFIPRRLSVFNHSSLDQVESDEDQANENEDVDSNKFGRVLRDRIRHRWLH